MRVLLANSILIEFYKNSIHKLEKDRWNIMENKIELIKSVFGDLLESIKGNNDYLTIELKDDWHNCICGISLNANTEYLEKRLH